jgi:hypothetical protein
MQTTIDIGSSGKDREDEIRTGVRYSSRNGIIVASTIGARPLSSDG